MFEEGKIYEWFNPNKPYNGTLTVKMLEYGLPRSQMQVIDSPIVKSFVGLVWWGETANLRPPSNSLIASIRKYVNAELTGA